MITLFFVFFKELEEVEVSSGLRVSAWLETDDSYLMPCEFIDVTKEDNFYSIRVNALDPDDFISKQLTKRKFLFGHPGKVIGSGILKEVE